MSTTEPITKTGIDWPNVNVGRMMVFPLGSETVPFPLWFCRLDLDTLLHEDQGLILLGHTRRRDFFRAALDLAKFREENQMTAQPGMVVAAFTSTDSSNNNSSVDEGESDNSGNLAEALFNRLPPIRLEVSEDFGHLASPTYIARFTLDIELDSFDASASPEQLLQSIRAKDNLGEHVEGIISAFANHVSSRSGEDAENETVDNDD